MSKVPFPGRRSLLVTAAAVSALRIVSKPG